MYIKLQFNDKRKTNSSRYSRINKPKISKIDLHYK